LVTWALTQLVERLETYWPLLLGIVITAIVVFVGGAVWRRRDYWQWQSHRCCGI